MAYASKEKHAAYCKAYYLKNRVRLLAQIKTPEIRQAKKAYWLANKAWLSAYGKAYRAAHRAGINANRRVYFKRIRMLVQNAYGNKCACPGCEEAHPEFLTIDHINGNGRQHRKEVGTGAGVYFYCWLIKQGFPKDNFRLLCMNCNHSLGMFGYCPHSQVGSTTLALAP